MKQLKTNIWAVSIFVSLLGFITHNPLEFILAVLMIPLLIQWFLRSGEPPVILFGFLLQWLSISLKIIYSLFIGTHFSEIMSDDSNPDYMSQSFYLSLIGLFIFALGTHLVIRRIPPNFFTTFWSKIVNTYDARKVLYFYIAYVFLQSFLSDYLFLIPGLTSFIVVFERLKWGFFLVTFYIVHKQNNSRNLFYFVAFTQFILGFGFFSGFKEVIYFTLIGIITIQYKFKPYQLVISIIILFLLLRLGVMWSAVKGEYRNYLTGGMGGQQVIVEDKMESLTKLWELSSNIDDEKRKIALDGLIDRISYIDYFSLTLAYVPEVQPYENGKVWSDALMHILIPRFLNPNKVSIDDSEHTSKYTGRTFTGEGRASFALGYTADAYIDFGPFFMFIPIFLLGLATGLLYKFLLVKSLNLFWGTVFIAPFLQFTNIYGTNTIKVIGWLFSYFLVILVLRRFIIKFLNTKLLK